MVAVEASWPHDEICPAFLPDDGDRPSIPDRAGPPSSEIGPAKTLAGNVGDMSYDSTYFVCFRKTSQMSRRFQALSGHGQVRMSGLCWFARSIARKTTDDGQAA